MLTKDKLVEAVHREVTNGARKTGRKAEAAMTKAAVERVLDAVLKEWSHSLGHGYRVSLAGLGALYVRPRPATKFKHPKTGETMDVAACKVVRFSASKKLKSLVNRKTQVATA